MPRPKIKIALDPVDWVLEITGLIGIIILVVLPAYYYNRLPDTIPRHFDLSGTPDGYSGKMIIWTLPALGIVLYAGLSILNRFPHIFNYLQDITEKNAEHQYRLATKMIRFLNAILVAVFVYITYATIQTALGNQNGLGPYFSIFFISGMTLPLIIYLFKSSKKL